MGEEEKEKTACSGKILRIIVFSLKKRNFKNKRALRTFMGWDQGLEKSEIEGRHKKKADGALNVHIVSKCFFGGSNF